MVIRHMGLNNESVNEKKIRLASLELTNFVTTIAGPTTSIVKPFQLTYINHCKIYKYIYKSRKKSKALLYRES